MNVMGCPEPARSAKTEKNSPDGENRGSIGTGLFKYKARIP